MRLITLLLVCIPLFIHAQVKFAYDGTPLRGAIKTMTEYECCFSGCEFSQYAHGPYMYKRVYACDTAVRLEFISCYVDTFLLEEKIKIRFDVNGAIIEQINYSASGQIWKKILFQYDAAGREIERLDTEAFGGVHGYDGDTTASDLFEIGNVMWVSNIHKYDEKGQLLEEREELKGNTFTATSYKYDNRGNVIEEGFLSNCYKDIFYDFYDADGRRFSEKKTFKFDSINRLLESSVYQISPDIDSTTKIHSKYLIGVRKLYRADNLGFVHAESYNIYREPNGSESLGEIHEKEKCPCFCTSSIKSEANVEVQDSHGNALKQTRSGQSIVREIAYFEN